ncbi:hypothetical protein RB195_017224 [Necator americanus]|uniref:Uncharacterized protein n=1 Tax=Necator americanus TaxID=51031 RepID=A0ABR1C6N6_NECAM
MQPPTTSTGELVERGHIHSTSGLEEQYRRKVTSFSTIAALTDDGFGIEKLLPADIKYDATPTCDAEHAVVGAGESADHVRGRGGGLRRTS